MRSTKQTPFAVLSLDTAIFPWTIANGSFADVPLNKALQLRGGMTAFLATSASVAGFIIVPESGVYSVSGQVSYGITTGAGSRCSRIGINGVYAVGNSPQVELIGNSNNLNGTVALASGSIILNAGDRVYLSGYQSSGAGLSVNAPTTISLARVG